jgi:FAD:protein FMN transferase
MDVKAWFLICLPCWACLPGTAFSLADKPDTLRRFEFSHPQMGTVFRLVMYAESELQANNAANQAFTAVDSMNACMSDYLPDSELSLLCNTAGSGRSIRVSKDLWRILKLSVDFSRQTDGAFDVTIGPLTRLWRRARNLKALPDSSRVLEARALVGFQNLVFKKGKQIELKKAGMRLDLGGIAQGYAADRCLEILRKNGIQRALADAGGDIALGAPPPGEAGWVIEIPSPIEAVTSSHRLNTNRTPTTPIEAVTSSHRLNTNHAPTTPIEAVTSSHRLNTNRTPTTLRLANCGITTSGATFRYLEINGKRYSHIIDPQNGWGLTHHILVTVQAPNATQADAWATAISVMGESGWNKQKMKPKNMKVWMTETKL